MPRQIDDRPVFSTRSLVEEVLIRDCAGHGRSMVLLMEVIPLIPTTAGPEVKTLVVNQLQKCYDEYPKQVTLLR